MKKFILQTDNRSQRSSNYQIPYREQLNTQQLGAVMHDDGPALVIAGAGTGKTRTLVYRVARLVEDGTPPESILLLTFTRRAAREMLNRATDVLDNRCKKVRGGTFHHYCNLLLHRYAEELGYPRNFTLLDQSDAMDTIHHIRSTYYHHLRLKRFPQKQTLSAIFSSMINTRRSLYEVLADGYPRFLEHHDAVAELFDRYNRYKRDNGVMDFDDLLTQTRVLLSGNDDIRRKVASQNRYVMVDEYQDTNNLQADLVALFSSVHENLMVVGDDAQSIYAFRGANFKNILAFPDLYDNCKILKLEENYRSAEPILKLANSLMDKANDKFDKNLYTRRSSGDLPGIVKASNENEQSRFVAQMLLQLREQEIPLNDMAVLFRNGRDSYDLEWELNKLNIPFRKFGGQKFAEAAHIRDVLAHLRVVVNPEDQIAWNRILMLVDGIGPKTASELVNWLRLNKNRGLREADVASKSYKKQIDQLSEALSDISTKKNKPSEALERIIAYYTPVCENRYDDHPKRIKDLEAFAGLSRNYTGLDQLLQDLTLEPLDASAMETEASAKDEPPLTLTTIHSAKGLEWDTVFIIQCLDGVLPSGYAVENASALDEELRLLYVACTRARERLFISYPVTRESSYGEFFSNPSRFLEDIPEYILETWKLVEEPDQKRLGE
ncbi:ATP-dependent helicase [Natronogracilivirga saccharolytica]|uniref:DNA 3'-5' helicase n=1 Tax=Natronogracilivirga saccharolytica TaxID=2812953 RepID=A0A8J7RR22_9BACT|nr:ATP-dependent helicase [Natronogracilivirga saccharolytica]MBP3192389.1 ATP-dependent helicase [Natronogracilivirga saccharolytica]